jgi:hypothetical protein
MNDDPLFGSCDSYSASDVERAALGFEVFLIFLVVSAVVFAFCSLI